MEDWKPDRILKALVFWITYMLVFSWLPLVRILMDGDSYRWGTTHFGVAFSAAGWEANAWLLVFKSSLLIGLLWGALRGANALFRVVLLVWSLALAADVMHTVITDSDGFEFHGETLGIHLNLGWPVVLVTCGFTALALFWVIRDWRRGGTARRVPWTAGNTRGVIIFLALLPLQFLLLRFGEPYGTTDAIGVLVTIASCPLLAWALYPRSPSTAPV
jgi:hypothetical protein